MRGLVSISEISLKRQLNQLHKSIKQDITNGCTNVKSSSIMKNMLKKVKNSNLYCILQPNLMADEFWDLMDKLEELQVEV